MQEQLPSRRPTVVVRFEDVADPSAAFEPIIGVVELSDGAVHHFTGWMELIAVVERALAREDGGAGTPESS